MRAAEADTGGAGRRTVFAECNRPAYLARNPVILSHNLAEFRLHGDENPAKDGQCQYRGGEQGSPNPPTRHTVTLASYLRMRRSAGFRANSVVIGAALPS